MMAHTVSRSYAPRSGWRRTCVRSVVSFTDIGTPPCKSLAACRHLLPLLTQEAEVMVEVVDVRPDQDSQCHPAGLGVDAGPLEVGVREPSQHGRGQPAVELEDGRRRGGVLPVVVQTPGERGLVVAVQVRVVLGND